MLNCLLFLQDNVVYERLGSDRKYTEETLAHLEQFASIGERNLVFLVFFGIFHIVRFLSETTEFYSLHSV